MEPQEILDEAIAAAGVGDVVPLVQGGQKLVFKATLAGNPVVLKVVPIPEGPSGSVILERAHREVELLAAVDSPHVVAVLSDAIEIFDPPVAVVWIEEMLDGQDLTNWKQPDWTDEETLRLLRDLAEGLTACHQLAVVHRDLSPGNVRVTSNESFVLMDPGLARHLNKIPLTGVFQPGTAGFRSPEHVPGGNPTPASDIFGVGILAHVYRTGTWPINPQGNQDEYDRRLREGQAAKVQTIRASIGDDLALIIDRCLQRQPARRFIDGWELLDHMNRNNLGRA